MAKFIPYTKQKVELDGNEKKNFDKVADKVEKSRAAAKAAAKANGDVKKALANHAKVLEGALKDFEAILKSVKGDKKKKGPMEKLVNQCKEEAKCFKAVK